MNSLQAAFWIQDPDPAFFEIKKYRPNDPEDGPIAYNIEHYRAMFIDDQGLAGFDFQEWYFDELLAGEHYEPDFN